jgi:rhamnose utilization protein RhaD (predicted bifunctional aldolase and dehydrogenase)
MMMPDEILTQLIAMSHRLGDPALDCAILGEGNTSARADADTFWVKTSGTELRTIDQNGFARVSFERVLAILKEPDLPDQELDQRLNDTKIDPAFQRHPSVETILHALCLSLEGVNFVGHTHPTAVNAITCSAAFETAVSGRLFPDEIVLCGPAPVVVPYTDPGPPLARKVHEMINRYIDDYGERPRTILIQNHGLIALGRTPQQVENVTAMAVKAARVLLGTYSLGGPHFMTPQAVKRIHTRPDETYRRLQLGE